MLSLLAELLIALLAIYNYGFTLEGLQATTRFSGRLSLVIFSLVFILLSLDRKNLSLKPFHVFAIAHGIHLAELLSYVILSKANLIPVRLAGGFLAYVLIFTMPAIHSYYTSGKITPRKYILAENVYLYYVLFIFFMTYLPRIQGKLPNVGGSYPEFVALFVWVCALILMRLVILLYRRLRTNPITPK